MRTYAGDGKSGLSIGGRASPQRLIADGEHRVMVLIEILSKPIAVRVAPASLRKAS